LRVDARKLNAAGHLHWTDPLHLRLSEMPRSIRRDLREAEASL
jgi:hypothetical protein